MARFSERLGITKPAKLHGYTSAANSIRHTLGLDEAEHAPGSPRRRHVRIPRAMR
jgi:hypothetical protein